MEHIFKVENLGYYTTLEEAVKIGKDNYRNIYKISLNKENNYQQEFLEHKRFGEFNYYLFPDGTFYDPQDSDRLQEEKNKIIIARAESFEKKKSEKYQKAPKLGWCDYPEQFAEKCPNFNGVVKFKKITRIIASYYKISTYHDYSSKYVDSYYPAIYIGNYDIAENSVKFEYYDGITSRFDGIFYPKIDEIWEFETDRFPFGNFIWDFTLKKKVINGKMLDYTEPDSD
jgi:hypothetical protein